jgi:hypothetical protein
VLDIEDLVTGVEIVAMSNEKSQDVGDKVRGKGTCCASGTAVITQKG